MTLTEEITDMFVQDTNLISFMYLQKQTCPSSFLLTSVLFILPRGTKLEYFTTLIYCLVTKGLNVPVGRIFRQQTLKQLVSPVVKCQHNVEFYQICNIWTACLYVQVLTRESFPCHHQELAFALGTLTFSNGLEFRIRFILVVSVATVCRRSFHMHLFFPTCSSLEQDFGKFNQLSS